jgi:hypothetical protein
MTDPSNIKINGLNEFVNKFNTKEDVINLNIIKEKFRLDQGETGFYRLSLSQKRVLGDDRFTETYNRPSIGPLPDGTYCTYCGKIGPPDDHSETCPFPEESSLYLTLRGVFLNIIKNPGYSGEYVSFRKLIKNEISQEQLNDILLIEDQYTIRGEPPDISASDIKTNIPYSEVLKKRGPEKLAYKTSTTQFLNNIIIYYEKYSNKTSIRISKNGLINIINTPINETHRNEMINELIKRMNETGGINEFSELPNGYVKIPRISYIHSATAQFSLWEDTDKYDIIYNTLDSFISPYNTSGKIIPGKYSTVETTQTGKQIITIGKLKIVNWEYSLGRETRGHSMSKEYIKFTALPRPGIKMSVLIHKHGSFQMTLSYCSDKETFCARNRDAKINVVDFELVRTEFIKIFNADFSSLTRESLSSVSSSKTFNTVSGYAPPNQLLKPSTGVCRAPRRRDDDTREEIRPSPYSWSGQCPDPNYQYIKPHGIQGTDQLYYPCCSSKTEESRKLMVEYLRLGFPRSEAEAIEYNVGRIDNGSGILIPGSNEIGAKAMVKVPGTQDFQQVTVLSKGTKKSNEYVVKLQDGTKTKVHGNDFLRDSRIFPGLRSLQRDRLLTCIQKYMRIGGFVLNKSGGLERKKYPFNVSKNDTYSDLFKNLVNIKTVSPVLVLSDFVKFETEPYNVTSVPDDTYHFYLVLGSAGNFYISKDGSIVESDISEQFDDTIVFDGFMRLNDTDIEYFVIDVIYYKENVSNEPFELRKGMISDINTIYSLSDETDDILKFPEYYDDIIDGSRERLTEDKNSFLIFMPLVRGCCNYFIWTSKTDHNDIILQVISKTRNVVQLGYDSRSLPENIGLQKLNSYTIPPPVPKNIKKNDYVLWRINKDSFGNFVPSRVLSAISIVNKPTINYDDYIKKIEMTLNPINIKFFLGESWEINERTMITRGDLLKESL